MKIDYSETVIRETVYEFRLTPDQKRIMFIEACKAAAGLADRDDLIVEWDAIEEYHVRIIAPHPVNASPETVEATPDAQVGISWGNVTVKEDAASTGEFDGPLWLREQERRAMRIAVGEDMVICDDAPVSVGPVLADFIRDASCPKEKADKAFEDNGNLMSGLPFKDSALRAAPDDVSKSRTLPPVKAEVKIIADHIRSLKAGFSPRRSHDIAACLLNGKKATEVAAEMGETVEDISAHFRAMIHKSIKAADGNISIEGRKVLMNALEYLISTDEVSS